MYCVISVLYQGERPYGNLKTVFLDKARNWVESEEAAERFEKIEDTGRIGFLPPSHNMRDIEDIGVYEIGTRWIGPIPAFVHRVPHNSSIR